MEHKTTEQEKDIAINRAKEGHIYVTWGGAAIVLNSSPTHIQGCYTEGLTTCICIVVKGENGFAFLHDTLFVSDISMERLFSAVGHIEQLFIICNPKNYPNLTLSNAHLKKLGNIFNKISQFEGKENENVFLYKAVHGFVSMSRILSSSSSTAATVTTDFTYHINTTTQPSHMISLPFMTLRLEINNLNWFFTYPGEGVPCDLHYNGQEYLNLPKFMKTPDEMGTLIKKHPGIFEAESKVPGSETTRKQLTAQHREKIPHLIQEREQALKSRNVLLSPPLAEEREKMFQQRDSQDFVNKFLAKQKGRAYIDNNQMGGKQARYSNQEEAADKQEQAQKSNQEDAVQKSKNAVSHQIDGLGLLKKFSLK